MTSLRFAGNDGSSFAGRLDGRQGQRRLAADIGWRVYCAGHRTRSAQPQRKAHHCHEHDGAGVSRLRRSIDHGDVVADDRPRAQRCAQSALAGHRLSDRRDCPYSTLRQIRRYPRQACGAAYRAEHLHAWLHRLGHIGNDADADLRPSGPGLRRRRTNGHRTNDSRRHRLAEGAGEILRFFFNSLHNCRRLRAAARGLDM